VEAAGGEEGHGPLGGERALRLLAEERAARAEKGEAALRATCVAVTSVAELSIEAAAQLVDEARRYAQVLAEAVHQEKVSGAQAAAANALQVIVEARAAVAQLRTDLLGDEPGDEPDPDSEPGPDGETAVGAPSRGPGAPPRSWRWRRTAEQDKSVVTGAALLESEADRQGGPLSTWAAPPTKAQAE